MTLLLLAGLLGPAASAENDEGFEWPVFMRASGSNVTAEVNGTLGENGWFVGPVNVTLHADGDAVVRYRVNEGLWTLYTGPFSVAEDARVHTVEFGSEADIEADQTGLAAFRIDSEAPETSTRLKALHERHREGYRKGDRGELEEDDWDSERDADEDEDRKGRGVRAGWFRNVTLVQLRAGDNTSGVEDTFFRVDGEGNWTRYQHPFFVVGEGNHSVEYWSVDRAGHREPVQKVTWGVDTTPPDPSANLTGEGAGDEDTSTGNETTTDDGSTGGNSTDDGSTTDGGSGTDNSTSDGSGSTNETSSDTGGNSTAGSETWHRQNVTVDLDATDNLSGVAIIRYSTDNVTFHNYTLPLLFSVDGVHTTTYMAWDLAGNPSPAETVTVRIDTMPPSLKHLLSGPTGELGWYTGAVTLDVGAADNLSGVGSIAYGVDGAALQSFAGETNVTGINVTGDGLHKVALRALDVAGNAVDVEVDVGIDATPPMSGVRLVGNQGNDGYLTGNVRVYLEAVDNVSGVSLREYSLDGGPWTTYSGTFLVSREGTHTLAFRATDHAGNVEAARTVTFTIDNRAPATALSVNGALAVGAVAPTNDSSPTLSLAAADRLSGVNTTYVSVDGAAATPYTGPFSVEGEGDHVIAYWSVDKAGNVETRRLTTVQVDLTAPVTEAVLPETDNAAGWHNESLRLELQAEDNGSGVQAIRYAIGGGSFLQYGSSVHLADGDYMVVFHAVDRAGNEEATKYARIRLDTTSPTTTLEVEGVPGQDGWYRSEVRVLPAGEDGTSGVLATYASVNDGPAFRVTEAFHLSDGVHNVTFWSVDRAGNVESERSTVIRVDSEGAQTDIDLRGVSTDDSTFIGAVHASFRPADNLSGSEAVFYRIDGGAWRFASSNGVTIREPGEHTLEAYAVDAAGNIGAITKVAFEVRLGL